MRGLLLFGEDVVYMSHCPTFDSPHNFQVLLEVGLSGNVRSAVLSHNHAVPTESYDTFVPDAFPIIEPDPGDTGPAWASIAGTIVCGHVERKGGKNPPIATDIEGRVDRVGHFSQLDVDAKPAEGANLAYLCFGHAGRLYLAHAITARPSFDQVLQARFVPCSATDQAGRALLDDAAALERFFGDAFQLATPVTFEQSDVPGSRLAPGQVVAAWFSQKSPPSGFHGVRSRLELAPELYLEIDERTDLTPHAKGRGGADV